MTAYLIADIKVTDGKWVPDYAASVHELVHKHGGKYLSRSGNVKTWKGTARYLADRDHAFPRRRRRNPSLPIRPMAASPRRAGAAARAASS